MSKRRAVRVNVALEMARQVTAWLARTQFAALVLAGIAVPSSLAASLTRMPELHRQLLTGACPWQVMALCATILPLTSVSTFTDGINATLAGAKGANCLALPLPEL